MPITRWYNYFAASVWGDPPASYLLDAFRIYDYALTQTQVQSLATQYGLNSNAPIQTVPPVVSNLYVPQLAEDIRAAQAVPRPALFNGSFSMNLTSIIAPNGGVLNYQWLQSDPLDNAAAAALHQGVVLISGAVGSYIDLSNNQGPNSVGLVMPTIGNAGYYPFGDPRQGMSFEFVFKLNVTLGWAKIADIGDGAGIDDVVIGWDGNDYGRLSLQNINNAALTPSYVQFFTEMIRTPVLGQWYHLVVAAQAVNATLGTPTGSSTSTDSCRTGPRSCHRGWRPPSALSKGAPGRSRCRACRATWARATGAIPTWPPRSTPSATTTTCWTPGRCTDWPTSTGWTSTPPHPSAFPFPSTLRPQPGRHRAQDAFLQPPLRLQPHHGTDGDLAHRLPMAAAGPHRRQRAADAAPGRTGHQRPGQTPSSTSPPTADPTPSASSCPTLVVRPHPLQARPAASRWRSCSRCRRS